MWFLGSLQWADLRHAIICLKNGRSFGWIFDSGIWPMSCRMNRPGSSLHTMEQNIKFPMLEQPTDEVMEYAQASQDPQSREKCPQADVASLDEAQGNHIRLDGMINFPCFLATTMARCGWLFPLLFFFKFLSAFDNLGYLEVVCQDTQRNECIRVESFLAAIPTGDWMARARIEKAPTVM